jgi:hypothetical protein
MNKRDTSQIRAEAKWIISADGSIAQPELTTSYNGGKWRKVDAE